MFTNWVSPPPQEEIPKPPTICGCAAKKFWIILALVVLALVLVAVLVAVLCILLIPPDEDDMYLATELLKKMNTSVNPCHNFHAFACGGWLTSEDVREASVPVSTVRSMQENIKHQIIELLKQPVKEGDPIYKVKPRKFFQACNNVERIVQRGKQPLLNFLKGIGSFPIIDSSYVAIEHEEMIAKLAPLGAACIFTIYTEEKYGRTMLYIRNPPKEMTKSKKDEVNSWFRAVLTQLGYDTEADSTRVFLSDLLLFENELLKLLESDLPGYLTSLPRNDKLPPYIISIGDLHNNINWMEIKLLIQELTKTVSDGETLADDTLIHVENIKHLIAIYEIDLDIYRSALPVCMLRNLLKFTSALDPSFKPYPNVDEKVGRKLNPNYTREERCATEAMELLPELVHRLYMEEYKPAESTVAFLQSMINTQKGIYGTSRGGGVKTELIPVKEKINSLKVELGYPETFQEVEMMYKSISTDEYFEAVVALVRFRFKRDISDLFYKSSDLWKWKYPWKHHSNFISKGIEDFGPTIIENKYLDIPSEILQSPVFNATWRSSMKFGALGSLLGSQIYKAGFLFGYTLPYTYRKCYHYFFNKKSFQKHEIKEPEDSLKIDQFLWDTAGIELSSKAYDSYVKIHGEESSIPGIDFSHKQVFFITYAQMMCEKIPADFTEEALSWPQLPSEFRVFHNLLSSFAFRSAFRCSDDYMTLGCPAY